jgi:serine protease Do
MVVEGPGTGFVLRSDGMIATNAHVVTAAQNITVTFADGQSLPETLVGSDEVADLAVISVPMQGLAPLELGRSVSLRVGDTIIAVGNALALEGPPSASIGIV